jgi:hypothetical protein
VSISLKPRVDFPQTTCRFPSNHVSISLKPRVDFPQTTCRSPAIAQAQVNGHLQGIRN